MVFVLNKVTESSIKSINAICNVGNVTIRVELEFL